MGHARKTGAIYDTIYGRGRAATQAPRTTTRIIGGVKTVPIVEPTNKSVLEYEGIHLYHTDRSNCSARVRLLLEEKELPWVSHHINLNEKENINEEYFGINPKGLVPSLVHDGTVVVESNDILAYLEDKYPEPGFREVSDEDQQKIDYWLKTSGEFHLMGIKTLQYFKSVAKLLEKLDAEYNRYGELKTDPAQLEFYAKKWCTWLKLTEEDTAGATRLMNEIY
ncbi:MAG TPA: glutathione S-transferase family protein [Rhodospirillales bacterium]|nr:glutathione S-transferase family protein [Rhodospirillales bacterium]